MVDLGRGLRNALAKITGATIVDAKAVKELVKELQRVLISNDVNVKLVFELTKRIEEKAMDTKLLKGLSMREHVVKVVYEELASLLGEEYKPDLKKQRIMLLGIFGSGKSTTCSKLALFYKRKGLTPALIACDIERPAAYEQLEQLAKQVNCAFYGIKGETDVKKIVNYALGKTKEDVLILDSAGRSAFDEKLTEELKTIADVFKPDKKFLVISADIGQVAKKQAEQFNNTIGVDGVIITKIDGSAKGGGALSAVAASDSHVAFIGYGEKIDDLETFDSKKFVGRLLGFPDLESLMEKAKKIAEEEKIKPEEIMKGKLTLKTFYEQLKAAKKMGPLKKVLGMMGAPDIPKEFVEQSEEKLKKFEAIISSLTEEEKEDHTILKKSRTRLERVAKGSGTSIEDVKELLRQFEKTKKMLDVFKKNRGAKKKLEKIMKSGNFKLPGMGGIAGL